MVRLKLQRIFRITRLADCEYALVWTSRPVLSKKRTLNYILLLLLINPLIMRNLM